MATTENGLTLSLPKLMRDQLIRPGRAWSGSIVWTYPSTGERVGSISYQAYLGQELRKQLARLADEADMTMRAFVLDALKAKGLAVRPYDLMDLRKERR